MRLAQEDLWVYEALLRIIENTNKGTTYENAAIKRIDALEIGKQAARSWGQDEEPVIKGLKQAATGKGAAGPGGRGRPGPGGPGMGGRRPARPGPFTARDRPRCRTGIVAAGQSLCR